MFQKECKHQLFMLATLLLLTIIEANPTTRETTTTSAPTTVPTKPPGCFYGGKYYPPGAEIENGYDPVTNWCYGAYCSKDGKILHWDKWNCKSTTTTTTSAPTTPPGCFYKGKHYPPGTEIENGYDPVTNWCYGAYCSKDSKVSYWDKWNCKSTTTTTTTSPTTPPGCVYKGKHYPPGAEIENGYDPVTNWCYGAYCSKDRKISYWDKWNCKSTTTTTEATTTDTTTTSAPTTPPGCFYNGNYYPRGAEIENGYDPVTNWCYGTYCSMSGKISYWDKWNCKSTTTTSAPITTEENTE